MAKIALIGAGSVVFTRRLLQDVVSTPALSGADIWLMDVDAARLELIGAYARRLAADTGASARVQTTTDRRLALEGADYVITTIRVGDDRRVDHGIPLKYGVNQSVADTIGPGGVFKALRTVPVLLDICRDVEAVCPDAWLLQYTNPMAISCWAIAESTGVSTVGLCHSVQRTTEQLAEYIGAEAKSVSAWVAGINHMAWFLRFETDGLNAYPDLWKALEHPDTYARDAVRFEVMKHFGYFVTESTRHMSEYVPYFRTRPNQITRFGLDKISAELSRIEARGQEHYDRIRNDIDALAPLTCERSDEYAVLIMEAMETGNPVVINGNVANNGTITNLPNGACVEVPCLVDRLGVHATTVGALPSQLAALNRSNIAVQELAMLAVLRLSRQTALHAIMLDPLTAAVLPLESIRAMFDEMWAAHGDMLARYS